MRKRLRKKLRLGEFQELGFQLRFELPEPFTDADCDSFWQEFVTEAMEAHGLIYGGGSGQSWDGFVTLAKRGSATEEHRALVKAWLEIRNAKSVSIGTLVDVWYPQVRPDSVWVG